MGGTSKLGVGLFATAILLAAFLTFPSASAENVNASFSRTDDLAEDLWDDFQFSIPGGKEAAVSVSAQGTVDFYVFTASQYADYKNPSALTFGYVEAKESARAFTHTVSTSGRVVVIDNADISTTGASPTGNVTYTITVTYRDALNVAIIGGLVLVVLVVIVAIAVVASRRRKAKQPPIVPPTYPGIPPQPPQSPPPPP